ncbi:MAG: methyl-accepting chemotaxis protein, partial [Thiopseudomonas sp.]|nr:methyl-accepting chemotaxis protein [Thiopseudomonas sp.]
GDKAAQRRIRKDNPDDAWYFAFVNSQAEYELHLDTNAFSGTQLKIFINYRSKRMNKQGAPILVAGVALDMQALSELISQYRVGENGFVSLVTQEGNIEISAADSILNELKKTNSFPQLLNKAEESVFELELGGESYFVSSIWIDSLKRFLILELPRKQLTQPIQQQTMTAIGISLLLLVIALLLIYPLSRRLTRPLRFVQAQLSAITKSLDLSKRIEINDQAEIGNLADEVNKLLGRMSGAIEEILTSSNRLNNSASQLAYTAGLVHKNTGVHEQVNQSMAAAIEQMSSSVAEITSTMEELSASSTQIADHSQSVVDVANDTLSSSQKGAQAMQGLQQRMAVIQADYEQSLQDILDLGNQSKEISKVMELINTLAGQTKLIAFNAALEASSAGESGKRFSVVAGEIRRLADSVSESTRSIEERIQTIQGSISRLVITSEKAVNSVQAGMDVSASTAQELNELVRAASRTSNAAQQISLSTKQQKTASSQVVIALRDIANASTNNAESVRNITDISEELLSMANTLNALVNEFTLTQTPAKKNLSEQP